MAIYTKAEFKRFLRALDRSESLDQVTRIAGRFEVDDLVDELGKEKCDAIFAKIIGKTKYEN